MGFWRTVFGLDLPGVVEAASAPTVFTVEDLTGGADIDPAVFGLESYATSTNPAPRIDRRAAIQVPAVKRSRDLVAGVLGGLPLDQYDATKHHVSNQLFIQPERNVPRSVTMTRLFEDLFFEEIAWWQVTERYWNDWPAFVRRIRPGRVTVDEDRDKVYIDGKEANQRDLIRFDSPTDGLLKAGARAIRTCLALDAYAANAAQGIPPVDFFTPVDDIDPFSGGTEDDEDDDEIESFLDDWATMRRKRVTGYVPYGLKYNVGGFDPKALQMAEQRQHAVLEIARVAGVDPEELGVSMTSRTYSNQFDRRKAFTDFTLGQYRAAVEDRLSMGDVTPQGNYVRFNLDAFLRSDPASRYAAYQAGLAVGALGKDEIRALEDKPPLDEPQTEAAPPPAVAQFPNRGVA